MSNRLISLIFFATFLISSQPEVSAQKRNSSVPSPRSTSEVGALQQSGVRLYPSVVRIQKGKSKTITAVAYDSGNRPVFDAPFNFSTGGSAAVSLSPALVSGDDIATALPAPPNLRTVTGVEAGVATVTASWNGFVGNTITVIVDDPFLPPTAVIHGDNDAFSGTSIVTTVGEPIELDAESSRGVYSIEWAWGDGDRTTELLSATHAYLAAGTYTLNLRVTNASGHNSLSTISVTVKERPAASKTLFASTIPEILAAYNSATGGEHIVIPAGTILDGELVLPARSFSDYVTIRSSATLPNVKTRISNSHAGLVILRGTYVNASPLIIKNGASKIRIAGLKFEPKYIPESQGPSTYYLVQIGEAFTQTLASQNPTKIILEHCVIDPPNDVSVVHAVLNDGYKVSLISNWLGNIKTLGGQDSQAVASFDGRGAHVYNNNFLEAASENIMYGGVVPKIDGLTGTNIEIRRCYFSKRLDWRVYDGESHQINVKNLLETKNARRMYVEGSVFKNHWDGLRSQLFAIVLKSGTTPGGTGEFVPWAVSEEIVIESNIISHIYGGLTTSIDVYGIGPFVGLKPNNISLKNNLVDDLSRRWSSPFSSDGARFLQPNNVEDLKVDHTTVLDRDGTAGTAILFASNNNFRLSVTNSIFGLGGYGVIGSGVGTGFRALNPGTGGANGSCDKEQNAQWDLRGNVMPTYGNDTSCYPNAGYQNSFPLNFDGIGFADLAGGNYKLSAASPFKSLASDGKDPGVDMDVLSVRTACTVSGNTDECFQARVDVPFTLRGRVADERGRPVTFARVTLTNAAGESRTWTTNSFGYFSFDNVRPGQYRIVAASRKSTAEASGSYDGASGTLTLVIRR